jgi:hypothetical protein
VDTPERGKQPFVIGDQKLRLKPVIMVLMLMILLGVFGAGFFTARAIYHPGCSDFQCQQQGLVCNPQTGKCE